MTTTTLSQYKFNDYPFTSDKKGDIKEFDRIEVQYFAECIADFISECETPMTVGLQGDWGTGKTSLMNMIKCNVSDRKSLKIDINTWHYSMFRQDEYLGIIIVQSLVETLANNISNPDVSKGMKETSKKIGGVLKKALNVGKSIQFGIPGGGVSINDLEEALKTVDDSLQVENLSAVMLEFKEEFKGLIDKYLDEKKDKDERIIFFVDDLDRIRPIKAVEVLETLKNFMDVKGCVFVLAVDYEIVQLGIAEKFGANIQQTSGKSFFDKIIQLPFTMPTCSYNIERYLSDLLQDSKFYNYNLDANPEDSAFFVNITEATVGRNPRSIKRAVNYASLLERIRAKNATKSQKKGIETTKLLYSIVCMQIAWPELFEYFVLNPSPETIEQLEDWDYLDSLPNAKKLFLRVQNVDEVKDNISTYFDTLYDLLDKDNSGYISDEQLKPLLEILKLVKLTSEKIIVQSENPLKTYRNKVINNAGANKQYVKFFDQVFLKSLWASVEEYEYKKAGERYFTMVCNRRQVGSLVSLKSYPIMIRIKEHRDNILKQLQEDPDYELYEKVLKGSESITAMSGIGDTAIDCTELITLGDEEKSKDILNKVSQTFKSINNI